MPSVRDLWSYGEGEGLPNRQVYALASDGHAGGWVGNRPQNQPTRLHPPAVIVGIGLQRDFAIGIQLEPRADVTDDVGDARVRQRDDRGFAARRVLAEVLSHRIDGAFRVGAMAQYVKLLSAGVGIMLERKEARPQYIFICCGRNVTICGKT